MNEPKQKYSLYFENIALMLLGILFLVFPLIFLSTTTDAFTFPKALLLTIIVSIIALVFGLKTFFEGKLKFRSSPFDLPVILLVIVVILSAIFSINRFDSLIAVVPFLFIILLYFEITNFVKLQKQLLFLLSCVVLGASASGLLSILAFFKIYLLPFQYTHLTYFNSFGSLLDQAVYFALVLPISGYFAYNLFSVMFGKKHIAPSPFEKEKPREKREIDGSMYAFTITFIVITVALGITVYMLFTTQKPLILPFETGLQTGFAAISQDSTGLIKSFLLGSGFGTYVTDFNRFKAAAYNTDSSLWSFTFFRSSSFILELLATTGLLGVGVFMFLIYKIVRGTRGFIPLLLAVAAALLLPFSFTLTALFFVILAIAAVTQTHMHPEKYEDIEFYFVALKRGLLIAKPEGEHVAQNETQKRYSRLLPGVFLIILLALICTPLFYAVRFFISDLTFEQSLVAASQNNGLQTYNEQIAAIKMFPYRDLYYRSFSQTNLALANSLALSQKSGKLTQQTQQNIVTLIQQSITAARSATTVAPLTSFNWNNLSTIYRSLIGFGQNADQFALLTDQQAIALDANNPQQYVDFGGIYYQIGQYDNAIRQFQIAVNLKPDYSNAYYNLGHALEAKGDLQNALAAYQAVKNLVASSPDNVNKINSEIDALQAKIGKQAKGTNASAVNGSGANQGPLNVNQPASQLPQVSPEVKIPGPTVKITPSVSPEPSGSVDTTPKLTPTSKVAQ